MSAIARTRLHRFSHLARVSRRCARPIGIVSMTLMVICVCAVGLFAPSDWPPLTGREWLPPFGLVFWVFLNISLLGVRPQPKQHTPRNHPTEIQEQRGRHHRRRIGLLILGALVVALTKPKARHGDENPEETRKHGDNHHRLQRGLFWT